MKNILIPIFIFSSYFICDAQISSLKIEAFGRGFREKIELKNQNIDYKHWKGFRNKDEKLVIDTLIILTKIQYDSLQIVGKDIDFSTLSTLISPKNERATDGKYYAKLFINGSESQYYDHEIGFVGYEKLIKQITKTYYGVKKAFYTKK